jgi:hypothetical protein
VKGVGATTNLPHTLSKEVPVHLKSSILVLELSYIVRSNLHTCLVFGWRVFDTS